MYKADRLLEDLQIYRIITGQVNSEDYASILEKMGWDQTKLSKLVCDLLKIVIRPMMKKWVILQKYLIKSVKRTNTMQRHHQVQFCLMNLICRKTKASRE